MKEASSTMLSGIQAYQSCLLSLLGKPDGQLTVRFLEGVGHIQSFPGIFLQTVIDVLALLELVLMHSGEWETYLVNM
jgi:hypothetical protein